MPAPKKYDPKQSLAVRDQLFTLTAANAGQDINAKNLTKIRENFEQQQRKAALEHAPTESKLTFLSKKVAEPSEKKSFLSTFGNKVFSIFKPSPKPTPKRADPNSLFTLMAANADAKMDAGNGEITRHQLDDFKSELWRKQEEAAKQPKTSEAKLTFEPKKSTSFVNKIFSIFKSNPSSASKNVVSKENLSGNKNSFR